jgi:hypothetical protein
MNAVFAADPVFILAFHQNPPADVSPLLTNLFMAPAFGIEQGAYGLPFTVENTRHASFH